MIKAINPRARVRSHACDWREAAEYLRGCDSVFGCVDGFAARSEIEAMCHRYLIPYIDIGMDVFKTDGGYSISAQVIVSMPGQPCMRCIGFLTDELLAEEARRYGDTGARPQVVWPNGVLASTAVGLFIEMMTPWHKRQPCPILLEYDGNAHTVNPSNVLKYVGQQPCPHFSDRDLGDPFFASASDRILKVARTNQ
jgi:molybdopterin/thiamine biosynthesis adenylyltransferase